MKVVNTTELEALKRREDSLKPIVFTYDHEQKKCDICGELIIGKSFPVTNDYDPSKTENGLNQCKKCYADQLGM